MIRNAFLFFSVFMFSVGFSGPLRAADVSVKAGCLKATVQGISLEIERNKGWLSAAEGRGDSKASKKCKESLVRLEKDLALYSKLKAEEYRLPEKVALKDCWVTGRVESGNILYVEGMSRSGPWYHVAGIAGDDYDVVAPGKKYRMTVYGVYPREYFGMGSSYVYIDSVSPSELERLSKEGDPPRTFQ